MAQESSESEEKSYTLPLVPSPVVTVSYGPTQVAAPASFVFKVLRDISTWHKWNTMVPRCQILSEPGSDTVDSTGRQLPSSLLKEGTLMCMRGSIGSLPFKLTALINKISPPDDPDSPKSNAETSPTFIINWCKPAPKDDWTPLWMLRFERTHEIRSLENDLCEVETWDCQAGIMAHPVKFLLRQKLQQQFKNWIEGLRDFCEEEWKAQQEGT